MSRNWWQTKIDGSVDFKREKKKNNQIKEQRWKKEKKKDRKERNKQTTKKVWKVGTNEQNTISYFTYKLVSKSYPKIWVGNPMSPTKLKDISKFVKFLKFDNSGGAGDVPLDVIVFSELHVYVCKVDYFKLI